MTKKKPIDKLTEQQHYENLLQHNVEVSANYPTPSDIEDWLIELIHFSKHNNTWKVFCNNNPKLSWDMDAWYSEEINGHE